MTSPAEYLRDPLPENRILAETIDEALATLVRDVAIELDEIGPMAAMNMHAALREAGEGEGVEALVARLGRIGYLLASRAMCAGIEVHETGETGGAS